MKKILLSILGIIVVIAGVVVVRTLNFRPAPIEERETVSYGVDANIIAEHMAQAIRFKTISYQPPQKLDPLEFEAFIAWVQGTYPTVHATLAFERLGGYSLLYKWQGTNEVLKPILLTSHYDVVPVIPGTEGDWTQPPFAGAISEGTVWGRGALDNKSGVITTLEAVTALIKIGFQPDRTVYLSFGHDEEKGGIEGAGAVAAHLKSQNIQLDWSLDEGSFVMSGMYPGMPVPMAMINVAEKGYVSLDLVARGEGGHSSMPPKETAVGILSEAIVKLQNAPMPAELKAPVNEMFAAVASFGGFTQRMAFANRWLFEGIMLERLSESPISNAMIRTTTAPTMLSGSVKENVLPIEAIGTVNFRLHPNDTKEDVVAHVKAAIDDDRIEIRVRKTGKRASSVSSSTAQGFLDIEQSVYDIYGSTVVVPGMLMAATDTRHYSTVADNSYRFVPIHLTPDTMGGFHGTNEKVTVDSLATATQYYMHLIKMSAGASE